jgi:undecaprenyl pyrophosphate synthase
MQQGLEDRQTYLWNKMDSTTAYFEVVNWPDFREGALAGLYGGRH